MTHNHMLLTAFVTTFCKKIRILLVYSSKSLWKNLFKNLKFSSYYFIEVMLNNWPKMSFSKKFKSIYKYFHYLKANVTMFNEFFVKFLLIGLIKLIHMFPWYILYNYINKFYNFSIRLNYGFKTWKNQVSVKLDMIRVIVIPPMKSINNEKNTTN